MKREEINMWLDQIIKTQDAKFDNIFCCGSLTWEPSTWIIETDTMKIIYRLNGECEVLKKENKNPVIYRDKNKNIYRLNGEWLHLKDEIKNLAGIK